MLNKHLVVINKNPCNKIITNNKTNTITVCQHKKMINLMFH